MHIKLTGLLFLIAALLMSCNIGEPTPDRAHKVEEGWHERSVIELLGEPSAIETDISPDDKALEGCDAEVVEVLIYRRTEEEFRFFLDNNDQVACIEYYFLFAP